MRALTCYARVGGKLIDNPLKALAARRGDLIISQGVQCRWDWQAEHFAIGQDGARMSACATVKTFSAEDDLQRISLQL